MKIFRNICLALALLVGVGTSAPPAFATQILLNNTSTRLVSAITSGSTTINVTPGDGAKFAAATGGNTIRATLARLAGQTEIAWEVVEITARSVDALTVTRAVEGTAQAFAIGDILDVRFTAGMTPGAIGALSISETATLTNKTFDTAGTGNVFKINGTTISAISGTGSVCMTTSCVMTTPQLGTPASGVATNLTGTAAGLTAGGVTTNATLTGDVTSVGNATTLTNAPVIAKVLTGYVSGSGTVASTDTILQAFQKINGNDALKAPIASPTFTGLATVSGGLAVTGGSFVAGNIYKQASLGLTLAGVTGSTHDFSIYNTAGTVGILQVPTGTSKITFGDTTDATSSTAGAVTTAGGLGVAKKLYVGTDVNVGDGAAASTRVTVIRGGSDSGKGAQLQLYRGATLTGAFGHSAQWDGGTSSNSSIAANTGLGIDFFVNGSAAAAASISSAGVTALTKTTASSITYPFTITNADSTNNGAGVGMSFITHAAGAVTGKIENVRDSGGVYSLRLGTFINGAALTEALRLKGTGGIDVTGGLTLAGGHDMATAWTAFTPTVACGSGAFTTASAAGSYKQIGKTVYFRLKVTITTIGTCGGSVTATLPVTAVASLSAYGTGREDGSTGLPLFWYLAPATGLAILRYDNAFIGANGYILSISGTYEAA